MLRELEEPTPHRADRSPRRFGRRVERPVPARSRVPAGLADRLDGAVDEADQHAGQDAQQNGQPGVHPHLKELRHDDAGKAQGIQAPEAENGARTNFIR